MVSRRTPVVCWMRDSVQPRQPSARILLLCRVVQEVAHARGGLQVLAASTSRPSQLIAGFAVSIKCRCCVSAEALFLNVEQHDWLLVGVSLVQHDDGRPVPIDGARYGSGMTVPSYLELLW
jgi:hypothetical protein